MPGEFATSASAHVGQFYAHCPWHKRRCKCSARRATPRLLPGIPASEDSHIRGKFLGVATSICNDEDWYGYVIPRIGHDSGLNQAAIAVTKAYGKSGPVDSRGQPEYFRSLNALQSACYKRKISNEDLLTVALCFFYEIRASTTGAAAHIHGEGVAAMLASKSPYVWPDGIAQTIYFTLSTLVFHNSVVLNKRSPFDNGSWADFAPTEQYSKTPCVRRIRHLAQILLIRLPSVIVQLRKSVRQVDSAPIPASLVRTLEDLLAVRDDAAGEACQDMISRHTSRHFMLQNHFAERYSFVNHAHFQALVLWWTTRLILLRLCTRVLAREPSSLRATDLTNGSLDVEKQELCDHIAKSMEHTNTLNPMSRWPYLLAIQPVYGAVAESSSVPAIADYRQTLRTALVDWHAFFLRSLELEVLNEAVLAYLSEALNAGNLLPRQ